MTQIVPTIPPVPVVPTTEPRDPYELAALARDVAIHGDGLEILSKHGLDQPAYENLKKTDAGFSQILDQLTKEWHSIKNSPDRVQTLTLLTFEQLLPKLFAIASDDKTLPNHVTEIAKVLAKAGGVGESKREEAKAEKFVIHIDLGPDQSVKLEATPNRTIEGEVTDAVTLPTIDLGEPNASN